ncbi:MAG: TonB-dependent receptor [Burkholderiales bacterium]
MTGLMLYARTRTHSLHRLRHMCTLAALASPLTPTNVLGAEQVLEDVVVKATPIEERADGPVKGYNPTRSSTFTKTDTPIKDIPASLTIVPAEVVRDQAAESLGEVLRYVPGVTVHQGEGNRDQAVLRGNSTSADFFVNGMRDDAQIFRDVYNLERVEVLKGPGGMIFGRGGAGGVINRVTKRPSFAGVAEVNVTRGSWDQLRSTLDIGSAFGKSVAWRLNAMAEKSATFRDGVDVQRYAVNPAVTWAGRATMLTLDYEHLDDARTADRGIPSQNGAPFSTRPGAFFGNADQSHARSTVDSISALLDHELGGGWQLKNGLRIARYDKFYQNVFAGSAVTAANTLTLSAYNNANKRTNVFNQSDLIKTFKTGAVEHILLTGVELGYQNSDNRRNTGFFGSAAGISVPATLPIATATRFEPNGTDADNNVRSTIAAAYVQDQINLTKQWKLLTGLRYDRFSVDFDDRRTATPAMDLSRTDNALSPRFGVIWSPNAASTYYVSYSYAFLPSGEQLSLASTTADLAPEKSRNYEAGARWDVLRKLTISSAVFRLQRDDVRVADPANPGFFVRSGQQVTEGFELGLQGDVTRHWHLFGGYAQLNGRITRPISSGTAATAASVVPAGQKIGLVPENAFSLWNKFDIGARWGAGLGLINQSSMFTSFTNTVKLPGYTRVDGALFYVFSGNKTRIALNVENVFDKRYFPTVDGDNNISPGAPRNFRLTLSTRF